MSKLAKTLVEHAAYNRDYEKVLAALHKLDREMFSEGI